MENASKALLIAGAILIAILLIAVAMSVFNKSKDQVGAGDAQMSAYEIQAVNAQFEDYMGTNIAGSQVRSLIDLVSAYNAKPGVTRIKVDAVTYRSSSSQVQSPTSLANVSLSIEPNAKYTVTMTTNANTGIVDTIKID